MEPREDARSPAWATTLHGTVAGVLLLAAAYVAAGKLGLALATVHANATAVWPPTGIALAGVLLLGPRAGLGVLAGAFAVNATTPGTPLLAAAGIAVGNTAEALIGALLIARYAGGLRAFERASDTFRFAGLASLATVASATLGVGSLVLTGAAQPARAAEVWSTWFMGDVGGALVVAPLVLLWATRPPIRWHPRRAAEALALMALPVAGGLASAGWLPLPEVHHPLAMLALPLVVWAAFRFGSRGTVALTAVLSTVSIAGTLQGLGPFGALPPGEGLLLAQAFLGVYTVTGLALAAEVAERRRGEAALRAARDLLEARVVERTADLSASVTALRQRESQLAQAQQLASLGSWEWDSATDEVTWSEELRRIHGLAPGDRVGTLAKAMALVHPDDRARAGAALQGGLAGEPVAFDARIVRPDGQVRWLHVVGHVDGGGGKGRLAGVAHDITDQRAAEAERRAAWQQAEENRRLLELNRLKTDFINSAAHELNTPLTPLKLQLHLLAKAQPGTEPHAKALRILERNVDRMALLIQDMLDVARMQSGRLHVRREPLDVAALVREAAATFEEPAKARGVRLEAALPAEGLRVVGDAARLAQVFNNLLSNAVKFTPEGGLVRVTAVARDGRAEVRVRDTGPGLAPGQVARLFQPFSQVHDPKEGPPGTGLGLYIARGIVEQHGGKLWVESDGLGHGCTFVAALPRELT